MSEQRVNVWVQAFKGRPTLVLQWFDPETGVRKSKSAKTSDPEMAEKARSDHEYELNHRLYQEASKLTWERFSEMFLEEYAAGLRPRSREKFQTVFDVFEEVLKPTKLSAITERALSRFVMALRERKHSGGKVGLAPQTIRSYLVALKTAIKWAHSQRLIPVVPRFPVVKVPKKKPQPIPAEAFEKLLEKAPDELWRTFLMCGWWAGLRLSEASHLQWDPSDRLPWIDWEGNRIVLPAVFAKSDQDQWMPLHPVLRQALAALPRSGPKVFPFRSRKGGGPLPRNGITNRVRAMAKQAGVKLCMHKLRKGFGCRAAKQLGKGNAPILHQLMRHSTMQVTMDYYANVDDVLQDAIGKLV
jgi:integrase